MNPYFLEVRRFFSQGVCLVESNFSSSTPIVDEDVDWLRPCTRFKYECYVGNFNSVNRARYFKVVELKNQVSEKSKKAVKL